MSKHTKLWQYILLAFLLAVITLEVGTILVVLNIPTNSMGSELGPVNW